MTNRFDKFRPMPAKSIKISGARQHNLKNLHVEIPREKLVVITGLSGSGKSSLAFDTLYAEGQRRYVESLSAYARQFLDQMEKPDVDFIEGLSPAIAIEQRSSGANPRSIIATTTEIYDYLRVLFSAVGQPHDPVTGAPFFANRRSRSSIKFWPTRRRRESFCWRRWCGTKWENFATSSKRRGAKASFAFGSMAKLSNWRDRNRFG